jgi:anti-sigma B factor antagonist
VPESSEPPPFTCAVTSLDGTVTVAPAGELDMGTCPLLHDEMTRGRADGAGTLVVDLRGVTFIDSSAIHLLLRWADAADRDGLELRVIPGDDRVRQVFEMTGVTGRLCPPALG